MNRMRRALGRTLVGVTGLAAVLATTAAFAPASVGATTTTWVPKPMCANPAPGHKACQGVRLVKKQVPVASTDGKRAAAIRRAISRSQLGGPAGGYTPMDLARAYGVNADAAVGATQTVAIVDAYDDPTVRADLNTFNAKYRLPAETAKSFRVVNQSGGTSLPAADPGWAGEITLDVQAVRGLCHRCKILLVEADNSSDQALADAVNTAVGLGATEVTNSYGGSEDDPENTQAVAKAYDHPGVVITASSGDDGWYDWDYFNEITSVAVPPSADTPEIPAAYPTVVGVGGTSLYLNPDSTRASEQVWNTNGPSDAYGYSIGFPLGASGSGCSTSYDAFSWQRDLHGYGGLGCGAKRSSVDVAAVADPFTGFDDYQSWGADPQGWGTVGGTSLSSPVIAAIWALAGGAHGVDYPALSLYGHFNGERGKHTYDVTVGGTGACDTSSLRACYNSFGGNPNDFALGFGLIDCGFADSGPMVLNQRWQCYAKPGYDGVAGVGTPKGVSGFTRTGPHAVIASPGIVRHRHAKRFSAAGTTDPFPGGRITRYAWNFGDGHTATGTSPSHTYAKKGKRTITLKVSDSYGFTAVAKRRIAVR